MGAIFRTADGAGVAKIYLSGYTPAPSSKEKIGETRADKMIEKTALGAEKNIAWEKCDDLEVLLEKLKKEKVKIVALEKIKMGTEIQKINPDFPMVLILGNEVDGVSENILQKCDAVISIPMRGRKESLNVSVAAGIAMYELLK